MGTDERYEKRLMDLEIKSSYQEDLLDQLNQVIVRQQQEIDLLIREVVQLRRQMPDSPGPAFRAASDELPPHY